MEAHYTEAYFSGGFKESYVDYLGSEDVLRREFRRTVRYLRRIGPAEGKCLEIGCAYGFFLQEARPYYEVYGVEMSEAAVRHCWTTGLPNVRIGGLTQDLLREIGMLDVVVMLDVIEHIDDLEGLIGLVGASLRPGGIFLSTTGDWSSLLARLTGASWRLIAPPLHIWYLTSASLDTLMRRNGLTRIKLSYPWKIVPIDVIVKHALGMLDWWPPLRTPHLMRNLGLPANLFDSMRLVYRKTS